MSLLLKPNQLKEMTDSERDLLYRLGSALLIHWDLLSDESQEAIRAQAVVISDGAPIVQADHQISNFIQKFKGGLDT